MEYNKNNKLKVVTLFSGYDSQCMALDRLKENFPSFDYELTAWSEIDKYAIQAHNAVYPQWADRNLGDVSKIDWEKFVAEGGECDLLTYSFPCTDISNAGLQKGLSKGSGTRSSLLWECCKAIEVLRPKYLMMENVKALVSDKFLPHYLKWQKYLEDLDYYNSGKVLNAKDYEVPQNRERIFLISIRKDGGEPIYHFPKTMPLNLCLKDVLEENVAESYYIKDEVLDKFEFDEKFKEDYERIKAQKK